MVVVEVPRPPGRVVDCLGKVQPLGRERIAAPGVRRDRTNGARQRACWTADEGWIIDSLAPVGDAESTTTMSYSTRLIVTFVPAMLIQRRNNGATVRNAGLRDAASIPTLICSHLT